MSTQVAIPEPRTKSRRAFWIRQTVLWHWMSSAVCLGAMVLFTVTGITLNHAADISSIPVVTRSKAQLPAELLTRLSQSPKDGKHALPPDLARWLAQNPDSDLGLMILGHLRARDLDIEGQVGGSQLSGDESRW